jgi:decaprenyl-phosphate phosphoribosyltransferase
MLSTVRRPASVGLGLLRVARPRQWVKNVLVLAAPLAAGEWLTGAEIATLALTVLLFVCVSASVYFINDCVDVADDRLHPVKRLRPIASGDVPVPLARVVGIVLCLLSLAAAARWCNWQTTALLSGYVAVQASYCFFVKRVALVDLAVVASGFLLRAMAGGLALNIPLSRWFLVTTSFSALFAVSAKRYSEAVAMNRDLPTRQVISRYTDGYLRFVWQLSAMVAVTSYGLWALDSPAAGAVGVVPWRQLSMLPFVFGILRYAMFAERGLAQAPEEIVWRDRGIFVLGLCWVALYGLNLSGI